MGGDARKRFSPRSRSQSEREITREHNSFTRGMFSDVPAVDIPDLAEADIYNFNNLGRYLETRTGSIEWGDHSAGVAAAPLPGGYDLEDVTCGQSPDNASQNYYSFTAGADQFYGFLLVVGDDIIGWSIEIDHGDGDVYEEVVSREVDGNTITLLTTAVESFDSVADRALSVVPPVKTFFFSEFHSKFILHLGGNIYLSDDVEVSGWTRCNFYGTPYTYDPNYGTLDISASISKMVEFRERVALFTDSGIYSVNVGDGYFFRVNTATPTNRIEDINASTLDPEIPDPDTNLYGRKRVYSYSRLTGVGDRDRLTDGVAVEWESGGCTAFPERDFGVQWSVDEQTFIDYPYSIRGLAIDSTLDNASIHATHYSVYATENIHPSEGVEDDGNNTEELVWEGDYPISWSATATVTTDVGGGGYVITLDSGSSLPTVFGDNRFVVDVVGESGSYGDGLVIQDAITPVGIIVDTTLTVGETISISFGGTDTAVIDTIVGNDVTTHTAVNASIGSIVNFNSGNALVTDIVSATEFTVDAVPSDATSCTTNYKAYFTGSTTIGGQSIYAGVSSSVTDSDLKNRSEVVAMVNRFWQPMADGELGDVFGLFAFCSTRTSQIVEYGQLIVGQEYFFGQHNKVVQYHNLGDNATNISHFKDVMAVKCLSRTVSFNTSSYSTNDALLTGRYVFEISYANEVSDTIGCVGPWAVTKILGSNLEAVLTNEPGLRMFNGTSYGENLLKDRILDKLKDIGSDFALSHSDRLGVIVWSKTYGD